MPELNQSNSDFTKLIIRYLSGNADDADVKQLEDWVMASPENKEQFMALKKSWILSGMARKKERLHPKQALQTTEEQHAQVVSMRNQILSWGSIAAAILLVGTIVFWLFTTNTSSEVKEYITLDTPESIELPDGSVATLNKRTTLSYGQSSTASKRLVHLKGDAFFEVQRDTNQPFVIQTPEIVIEVLGTSFYVDSRSEQNETQVIVASGTVSVQFQNQEIILIAGEKAKLERSKKQLTKEDNQDTNYFSFQSDTLTFVQASLEEVVFALNRHYHSAISIDVKDLSNCTINATFSNKSLKAILNILKASLPGISIQQIDEKIIISGQQCD